MLSGLARNSALRFDFSSKVMTGSTCSANRKANRSTDDRCCSICCDGKAASCGGSYTGETNSPKSARSWLTSSITARTASRSLSSSAWAMAKATSTSLGLLGCKDLILAALADAPLSAVGAAAAATALDDVDDDDDEDDD